MKTICRDFALNLIGLKADIKVYETHEFNESTVIITLRKISDEGLESLGLVNNE